MTTSPPLIEARNLHKRFGLRPVLRGVDLAVAAGEVVALLGANGAGKTTLMQIVAGLSKPDRGEVVLGGVAMRKAGTELRRYVGMVSHAALLYPHLSGLENLAFFAQLYDIQQPNARIEAVLHAVDLWPRRRDLVRTYSRGMVQRLAIARAILHDPPVLLLDEPDTGLDQTSAEMLQELIRQLGVTSRAILLTTHNLDRALAWADSLCLLADGKVLTRMATNMLDGAAVRELYASTGIEQR